MAETYFVKIEIINVIHPMNTQDYNTLPIGEKALMIWDKGLFLELLQEDGKYKIGFYQLYGSLVSVKYNTTTLDINDITMWDQTANRKFIVQKIVLN
jgi:hypothetical protein